uniref:Uncharacterized protein n=1 Tax=Salix viminalis TaxID=40686 RepID=A0A6N2L0S7_SALVM
MAADFIRFCSVKKTIKFKPNPASTQNWRISKKQTLVSDPLKHRRTINTDDSDEFAEKLKTIKHFLRKGADPIQAFTRNLHVQECLTLEDNEEDSSRLSVTLGLMSYMKLAAKYKVKIVDEARL